MSRSVNTYGSAGTGGIGRPGAADSFQSHSLTQWTSEPLPHEKSVMASPPFGWKDLPDQQKDIKLPTRKGNATEAVGFKEVKVNHFPILIDPPSTIHRYQVSITRQPRTGADGNGAGASLQKNTAPPKFLLRVIHSKLLDDLRMEYKIQSPKNSIGIISDFSDALFSTEQLEESGINFEREVEFVPKEGEDGRSETFFAEITPTAEKIDTTRVRNILNKTEGEEITSELEAIQRIYNILLKNLSSKAYVPVGSSNLVSFNPRRGTPLGEGLMSFSGYDVDFEITNGWKPFLNIMVTNTATIMSGRVRDVLASLFLMKPEDCVTVQGWSPDDFWTASKHLENFKVKYSPEEGKMFGGTVTRLSNKSISEENFDWNDNGTVKRISVYDYFLEKYKGIQLNKNGLCLIVNTKNLVPAEICEVKAGQAFYRKLSPKQTNAMLKLAKKSPDVLKPIIDGAIEDLELREDPIFNAFGVTIGRDASMLPIKARILPAPLICYGGPPQRRARISPSGGVWDNWNRDSKAPFLQSMTLADKWGILNTSRGLGIQDLSKTRFVDMLMQFGNDAGVKIAKPKLSLLCDMSHELRDDCREENTEKLRGYFGETKAEDCKIVFVILPHDGSSYYGHVKQAAELHSGILTQCVTQDNFQNPNPSEIKNIILKMNNKLGGVNHTVMSPQGAIQFDLFEAPVLILGADVTHPPPQATRDNGSQAMSYAALISSIDRTGMRYMTQVKAQLKIGKKAAEVIQDFQEMVKISLKRFKAETNQSPRRIIYFRDGVGDGQFQELLHKEMRQMRLACTSLHATYQPKITFITVQKRHKTRFFVSEMGTRSDGREEVVNAPAGTIVDTEIVHPTEMDSFLLSHKSILGTSRPTRYRVLWDDSDFTQDQIQQMTYYLCHMYTRCNRAVSIPAPTYYAHHAATRAKILAEALSGSVEEINKQLERTEINKSNPMHFI